MSVAVVIGSIAAAFLAGLLAPRELLQNYISSPSSSSSPPSSPSSSRSKIASPSSGSLSPEKHAVVDNAVPFSSSQLWLYRYGQVRFIPRTAGLLASEVLLQARLLFGDANIAQLRTHTGRPISADGALRELEEELDRGFVVCLAQEERFVWPAMRPGESVRVRANSFDGSRTVAVHTLSARPRVFVVPAFLTNEESDHLVEIASRMQLIKSKVGGDTGAGGEYRNVRTSSQTWIAKGSRDDSPIVRRVRERVFDLVKMPEELGEAMQLVHYNTTQHYLGHHDYAHKWESVNSPYVQAGGNRFITVIFYLNDVEEGGYTMFPFANSTNRPQLDENGKERIWVLINGEQVYYGNLGCDGNGLQVPPVKGTALIFYNLLEEHTVDALPDSYTLHAGCDVLKGEKYMANIWIRNKMVNGVLY